MKKLYFSILFCCIAIMGYSQAIRWGTKSSSPGTKNEFAWSIISDSSGNTVIAGYFTDSVSFGGTLLKTRGLKDAFVAKLDPNGNYLWATSFGSTGDDEAYGVCTDNAGNVYVTGYFNNTFHLSATDSLVSQGGTDAFVAKMNSSAVVLQKARGGFGTNDYGRAVACNVVTGDYGFIGDVSGNANFMVNTFYSNGNTNWNSYSSGGSSVFGNGITMDNTGKTYIIGSYVGTMTSPGNYGSTLSDIYIFAYLNSGGLDYGTHFGGSGNDYGNSIHINGAGDKIFMSGSFTYSMTVQGSVTVSGTAGQTYGFVSRWDVVGSARNAQWAKRSTTTNTSYHSVTADLRNNVFVCDKTTSSVTAFASYGNQMWTSAPTVSTATAVCNGVSLDKYGNVYGAGKTITAAGGGTLTFGDSVLTPGTSASAYVEKISRPVIASPTPGYSVCVSSQRGDSVIMSIYPSLTYKAGNVFTLQMDASGAGTFAAPTTIGTLTTTTNGVFHSYIPAGTPNNGRIDFRVLSSNPPTVLGEQDYVIYKDRPIAVLSTDTIKKCPASSATVTVSDTNHLTGSLGTNYTWTPSTGLSSTTSATVTTTKNTSGYYTVTVTDAWNGCSDARPVYLLCYPAPILFAGNDTTVCRGSGVQLHATATNITTYSWTPASVLTGTATVNPVCTPTAYITNITVTGATAKGCTATDNLQVTSPQTTANAGPVSYNTCLGGGVPLSGSSNGSQGANGQHYSWSPAAGLSSTTIKNPVATPTVTTKYFMVATDTLNGCTGKDSITIIVGTLTVTASNGTVTCGSAVTLTCSSTGSYVTPLSYTWTPASHLTATSGTTTSANPIQTTTYYVTMTTGNGCSGTTTSKVTVNKPNFNLAFTATQQLLSTPPFVAQFTNSTPSMASYNFTWNFGDGTVLQNNNATVFHTYQYNGNYDVTLVAVSIATGCSDTLFKGGYIFCTGGTGCTLTASVTATNGLTACAGDTVWLSSNTGSGYTYQWNFNGSPISGATNPTYGATVAGNYQVSVSNGACSVTSQPKLVSFTSPPSTPTITATGNINSCGGGGSILLSTNSGYSSYLWSTNATTQNIVVTQPGVYVVHVGNGTPGCTSSASYTATALPVPAPSICMVTTDSTSAFNTIYWDKTGYTSAELDSMIIYREVSTNVFARIGAVSRTALSSFNDTNRQVGPANGDPNIGAYRYKIAVKDSCGIVSAMSPYHNSVWFNDQHTGTFTWNQYLVEGQVNTPVTNFYLMRDSANIGDWRVVGTVAGTQTSLNDPNYSTYQNIANWRVDFDGFNCTPTMRYAYNGTQSTIVKAKSNITNNRTTTGAHGLSKSGVSVYPNPFSNEITVVAALNGHNVKAVLYNVLGEKVGDYNLTSNMHKLDLSDLKAGVYYLKVMDTQVKIVKQ